MNTQFSLICPSIRPQYWKEFCDSLKDNVLDWEVLFIGPNGPIEELPSNARWIKTFVKPSQCTHIGFMEAKGEYASITADDAVYFSPNHKGALDNMYNFIKNFPENIDYNKYKIAYAFRMFEDDFCAETTYTHRLNENFPLLYPFFVVTKEVYEEVGGYDNRFICGQCENDFLYRIMLKYGHTENAICPTSMVWAIHDKHSNTGSFRKYHEYDSKVMKSLWATKNFIDKPETFSQERKDEIIRSFINNTTIYEKSQGESGNEFS